MRTMLTAFAATVLVGSGACAEAETRELPDTIELLVDGLSKPVEMVADPTHDARFYVLEQAGRVRVVEDGRLLETAFWTAGDDFADRGWEQGLLGIALAPDWAESRVFYLNYTGRDNSTRIVRVRAESAHRSDEASEELVLRIAQPFANHNGGCMRFGPDGMLWIGTGDGGAANDPDDLAQNMESLLGKMLRIDVCGEPDEGLAYAIPANNPFVGEEGVRPEIWSYGLRNPWKYAFDSKGRLWIADVGQNKYEWVHIMPADSKGGENFGWARLEGPEPLPLSARARRALGERPVPENALRPVWYYEHHPLASITGGFLYEGSKVESLKGRYICADFMSGRMWTWRYEDGEAVDVREVGEYYGSPFEGVAPRAVEISSFGVDNEGELYIVDHRGGRIFKIVR